MRIFSASTSAFYHFEDPHIHIYPWPREVSMAERTGSMVGPILDESDRRFWRFGRLMITNAGQSGQTRSVGEKERSDRVRLVRPMNKKRPNTWKSWTTGTQPRENCQCSSEYYILLA